MPRRNNKPIEMTRNKRNNRPFSADRGRATEKPTIGRANRKMDNTPAASENRSDKTERREKAGADEDARERSNAHVGGNDINPGVPTSDSPDSNAAEKASGRENATPRKSSIRSPECFGRSA